MPPLHIKLGLMKNFVKTLKKDDPPFQYLIQTFPSLSFAKIKEGIFVGPQIRKLMQDEQFTGTMTTLQANAWNSFKEVVHGFLGNTRHANYKEIIARMLINYKNINANMSLKLHMLHSHLTNFPVNLGAESDEQGERFHQDLLMLERRYQGVWNENMLGDYCWGIIRETNPNSYKRIVDVTHIPHYRY